MTNPGQWTTKADIQKDLKQVFAFGDLDEQDIVIGENPPPRRTFDDDDEYNYRFGDISYESRDITPDLEGITQMLRMVDELETQSEDEFVNTTPGSDINVVISKLNPDVSEFVPKSATTSSLSNKENEAVADNNNLRINISVPNGIETRLSEKCNENQNLTINKERKDSNGDIIVNDYRKIDISKLHPDTVRDITTKLKNKISSQSDKNDFQAHKEKNVAIATLLKLYQRRSTPSPVPNEKPIKLFTPEYFQNCRAVPDPDEEAKKGKTDLSNQDVTYPESPKLTESSGSKDSVCFVSSSDVNLSSSTSNSLVLKTPVRNKCHEDPQVRESIKKVNNWFEKPKSPKPKTPIVSLGPISFKRKEISSKSPISDADSKKSSPAKVKQNVVHYRPSKYADDLSKMYMERSAAQERQQQDIWTRLEIELKAKDELLRKTKSDTTSSSQTGNDDTSN